MSSLVSRVGVRMFCLEMIICEMLCFCFSSSHAGLMTDRFAIVDRVDGNVHRIACLQQCNVQ